MNFDVAIGRILGHEGGYVNDPQDPGGETNWGITWPVLYEAIGRGLVPAGVTIAALTRDHAKVIYHGLFWLRLRADTMSDGVAYQLLDFAVNSGIPTAVRKLQTVVGVVDDGRWGPVSQQALDRRSESDLIMLLVAERLDFMTRLKNWPAHGRGWARRIAQTLRFGAVDSD